MTKTFPFNIPGLRPAAPIDPVEYPKKTHAEREGRPLCGVQITEDRLGDRLSADPTCLRCQSLLTAERKEHQKAMTQQEAHMSENTPSEDDGSPR